MGNIDTQNPSSNNYSNNIETTKDQHSFINNDNQISITVSNDDSYNSNSSVVKFNKNLEDLTQKEQTTLYSPLSTSINQENNEKTYNNIKNKENKHSKKKKKKKNKLRNRTHFKNILTKKSVIGICLNLFFCIWFILYILERNEIFSFPRASSNKKVDFIFSGINNDSFIGGFLSSLLCTIFNYRICFIYPEMILCFSYIAYVIYSIKIIPNEKFKENSCILSKNAYIFFVFIGIGELYKIFARYYLDI